jgi:hypothetical protein
VVRHFLQRLRLPALFEQHLPPLPGRPPALPNSLTWTFASPSERAFTR